MLCAPNMRVRTRHITGSLACPMVRDRGQESTENRYNKKIQVLLPKPARDPLLLSSYRPISILPALSKIWEHTYKIYIERCLGRDPYHSEQYGFRRGKSTIDALRRVCEIAERCERRALIYDMVALDIKNAFNTLRWRRILEETKEGRFPGQLMKILNDYLSDRIIVAHCQEGKVERVSQGSVLGPLLWNLVYDGLLKALDSIKDLDAIAFAGDLALVITIRKMQEIVDRVRGLVKTVA